MNIGELLFGNTDTPTRVQGTIDGVETNLLITPAVQEDHGIVDEYHGQGPDLVPKIVAVKGKAKTAPVEEKPVYKTYEDFDYEELLTYAGIDTYATSTVVSRLFPQLIEKPEYKVNIGPSQTKTTRAPALIDIYEEYTTPLFDFICDLELNGINYDVEQNRRLDKSMREEVAFLEDRIFSSIGCKVHLDSSDAMGKFLYGIKGLVAPHQTKSGSDSSDGSALLILAGLDPMSPGSYTAPDPAMQYLADIAKRKAIFSVHKTFISTYVEDYVQADGRVHALYNQFGTSTFRLSSTDPNLQQVPRAFGVKSCFNARPGYIIVYADLSSAEVRCLAAICQDPGMLKAIDEKLDFHSFSASAMFNIPYNDFIAVLGDKTGPKAKQYKEMRQSSKALTFGILYGSSAGGVANTLNVTVERAEELIGMYFKAFPGVKTYIDKTHAEAKFNQYVITPMGHPRRFYGTDTVFKGTAAYNAALRGSQNYVIQSSTSIIGAAMFAQINREIKKLGGICTATIHDALSSEVPIEYAAKAVELFFHYMTDWPSSEWGWMGLKMDCEVDVGFDWKRLETVGRGVDQDYIQRVLSKL